MIKRKGSYFEQDKSLELDGLVEDQNEAVSVFSATLILYFICNATTLERNSLRQICKIDVTSRCAVTRKEPKVVYCCTSKPSDCFKIHTEKSFDY